MAISLKTGQMARVVGVFYWPGVPLLSSEGWDEHSKPELSASQHMGVNLTHPTVKHFNLFYLCGPFNTHNNIIAVDHYGPLYSIYYLLW